MRKVTTVILLITTLLLGVGAIYLGIKLAKDNQAPDDSKAASCAWCEGNQTNRGSCPSDYNMFADEDTCHTSTSNIFCCEKKSSNEDNPDTCQVTFGGGVTGCITISTGCGDQQFTFEKYWKTAPNGTSDGSCVGTSTNKSSITLGRGTYCPRNMGPGGCGYCVQLDGNGGGVAQFTGNCTVNPVCGDGTKNGTEQCDPKATPTGCTSGNTCNSSCQCKPIDITAVCGNGTMETNEECEVGHENSCTGGRSCNLATCLCLGNVCGSACTTNEQCPTDHICDGSTNTCVLSACVNNSRCTNNGCTLPELPQTAIVSDNGDKIIIALSSVLLGILMVKFDMWNYTKRAITSMKQKAAQSKLNKQRKLRENFEDKLNS